MRVLEWNKPTVYLYRQLAVFLRLGKSLSDALKALEGFPFVKIRGKISRVNNMLAKGGGLDQALQECPELGRIPLEIYLRELPGSELAKICDDVADDLEMSADLKVRMSKAFIYPVVLLLVAAMVVTFMITFVLPAFVTMLEDFGGSLPQQTLNFLSFVDTLGYLALICALSICFYLITRRIDPAAAHRFTARLPLLGAVVKGSAIYIFVRNLALFSSMEIDAKSAIKASVHGLEFLPLAYQLSGIEQGKSLKKAMESSSYYPQMLLQVIEMGESGGALSETLREFSVYHRKQLEIAYHRLIFATESCAFLIVAGFIGWMVIAMYEPIFQLANMVAQ